MRIKIKKLHPDAVLPKYAKQGDAGMDLTAVSCEILLNTYTKYVKYNFGLSFEIPEGFVGFIFPRSSCYKHEQILSNCVGVVDSGYRGEVSAVMIGTSDYSYKVGERVAQLIVMPIPYVQFDEVDELSETERGSGGYGSTGR
jgi:dUTP pyrophosphatase